jgi:ferric-dicitrate binding protein FerR (iron transport regulator)
MNEKLNNYFFNLLSEDDRRALFQELDKDEVLRREFADQRNLLSLLTMHGKDDDDNYAKKKYNVFKRRIHTLFLQKVALQVAKYAAIIVLSISLWNIYRNYAQDFSEDITYTHIEVPTGQRTHVFLPDGTSVWLNAKTRLSYPSDYSAQNRSVELDGEGYFEVTSDEKHPFVVYSSLMKVNVLGTKFNIKSYYDETSLVTLIEGKVEIMTLDEMNKLTLKPNEQASISKTKGITVSRKIGTENESSWTTGEFYYLNEPLINIAKDLERRFNVKILISNESIGKELFTYRADENATLEQILRHLKGTKELNYVITSDQIRIFKQ